ncbi:MAG TPA: hypothetical protein PLV68_20220, partial [Ilumatobacteraceae bacterium]|nr:hypothetical protein [Ilumatobacteraceae bacterium]
PDHLAACAGIDLDPDGTLYYRYVLASRLHTTIDPDLLIELIAMVEFHQEHYGDFLEGVTDGGIAIEVLDAVIRHAG